ncbi:MAG: hypothetical protein RSA71_06360 [Eubacterium sp.]
MFSIELAGVTIGIQNTYNYIEKQCQDYLVQGPVDFTVSATVEEIAEEQTKSEMLYPPGICESVCLYRKICLEMLAYDCFYLHAGVVAVDGQGYAFSAASGTGKSTHIQLWLELFGERAVIINGDKPLVREMDGVFYAFGTPWRGKEGLGEAMGVPVKALCFLERGENGIRPVPVQACIKGMMSQGVFPKDAVAMENYMDLLGRFIESIPCYGLKCTISDEAVQLAYAVMGP